MKKVKTVNIVLLISTLILTIAAFVVLVVVDNKKSSNKTSSLSSVESVEKVPASSSDFNPSSENLLDEVQQIDAKPNPGEFTQEEINAVNAVVERYGDGVSVYFEDIDSGNTYTYNQDEKYFIASIIKAPYCMYLYQLASEGKLDLNRQLVFEAKHKQEGTGKLKEVPDEELPKNLTIRELIYLSIASSDNTAMKLLLNAYPYTGYKEYAVSLGIHYPDDVKYVVNGDTCARDAGVYIKALYEFIETNEYGEELKSDMMKTSNTMIRSKYPIARKYGWAELSFHDIAVVYAPHPYVLAICTNKDKGRQEDYKLFAEIAAVLEKTQQDKYDKAELDEKQEV